VVTTEDLLAAGDVALRQGRWDAARDAFERALDEQSTADAHLGLAEACWWLCDARTSVRHRERAWSLLRQRGDKVGAGRVALDLSIAHLVNLGNDVAARGWLRRAERVLEPVDESPLRGWVWLMQGYTEPAARTGHELIARALAHAQADSDTDLELVALSDLGLAEVVAGNVEKGMALLDEAMAGTLGGDYTRLDTVVFATCSMLAACHRLGDLDRATKWCRAADDFMATYGCPFLYARCRVHYGGVLVSAGRWSEAERELEAALTMAHDAGPGPRMEAVAQLADLRLRQGRIEEASALLDLMDDGRDGTLAAAALRMARGESGVAASLLERRARTLGDQHVETPATLAMLVEAQVADGLLTEAAASAAWLASVAQLQDRDVAHALAAVAAARVAAVDARPDVAMSALERAIQQFGTMDLPLDAATTRLELARLLAPEQRDLAVAEAQQALSTFERLGAASYADAAGALLRSLGATARAGPRSVDVLSEREQEVLRLVAAGLSNPEIAARLYISRKTASNHVSSILAKLGLRNRAEAAAFAGHGREGSGWLSR
jgi:DNA-binding NarL/FixJ family response regulator